MTQQFTDFLDNPISVGDIVTYPVASGSSSADMVIAYVVEIDPIVKGADGYWRFASMEAKSPSKRGYGCSYPRRTQRTGPGRYDYEHVDDPSKAYRIRVKRIRDGQNSLTPGGSYDNAERVVTVHNVDRVTVVTPLYTPRPEDPTHG